MRRRASAFQGIQWVVSGYSSISAATACHDATLLLCCSGVIGSRVGVARSSATAPGEASVEWDVFHGDYAIDARGWAMRTAERPAARSGFWRFWRIWRTPPCAPCGLSCRTVFLAPQDWRRGRFEPVGGAPPVAEASAGSPN